MHRAPVVDNGKEPDEPVNVRQLFWLPPATPYGNFQNKQFKVIERIDELNRKLHEAWTMWHDMHAIIRSSGGFITNRPDFVLEQCVFLMRRIGDSLLAMVDCLRVWKATGSYPEQIEFREIGKLWSAAKDRRPAVFDPHIPVLETLNNLANAYKHSFTNDDQTQISQDELCFFALDLKFNKLASGAKFYTVPVAPVVIAFEQMYKDAIAWLREFSELERPRAAS